MKHIKLFKEYINEALNILPPQLPPLFYHATYKALLPSIKKKGLDTRKAALSWEFSKPGVIYLSDDLDVAASYAEAAEEVSDEIYDSGIVVLEIPSKGLNPKKIKDDDNVNDGHSDTFEYHGQIPWSKIKKVINYG